MNDSPKKGRLYELDGIRGIIVFFIVFVHYYGRTVVGEFPIRFLPELFVQKGNWFVELYFIISGFVFAYSLRERVENVSIGEYFRGKLGRLYLPAIVATICDVTIRAINCIQTGKDFGLSVQGVLKTLTFADTLIFNEQTLPSVLWYIHVLMACYFVFLCLMKCRRRETYIGGIILLFYLGWYFSCANVEFPFLYPNVGRGFFCFSVGLLLYEFQSKVGSRQRGSITKFLAVVCLLLILLCCTHSKHKETILGHLRVTLTILFFPTLVLAALNIGWFGNILKWKPFVFFGKISMSMFFIHVPILNLYSTLINPYYGLAYDPNGLLRFDTVFGFVVIVSTIIMASILWYHTVEKRLCPYVIKHLKASLRD